MWKIAIAGLVLSLAFGCVVRGKCASSSSADCPDTTYLVGDDGPDIGDDGASVDGSQLDAGTTG